MASAFLGWGFTAGLAPTGTMPHSLVLVIGDTVHAAEAFDRHVAPEVPRIVLVDTFRDEAEESLRVAHARGGLAARPGRPGHRPWVAICSTRGAEVGWGMDERIDIDSLVKTLHEAAIAIDALPVGGMRTRAVARVPRRVSRVGKSRRC